MIKNGQDAGEIPDNVAPLDTARSLLSLLLGLRVLSRSRPERGLFRSVAKQAEALLT
jgi:TetR/AcrR family transcriptional repressor of nem operon